MSIFSKNSKNKLALVLACASILGGKAQAMNTNKPQSQQTVATVRVVATKNSNKELINWVKNHKWQLGVGGTLTVATAVTLTILGVKYFSKKNKDNNNIDKIPNNIKDDKTINILDVDNKKMDLKINLNQKNTELMSDEEAVGNCVKKLISALKASQNKELVEFDHKKIALSLTTILRCNDQILELFPNDGQLEERKYNFKQFINCLKNGKINLTILGPYSFKINFELPGISSDDDGKGPKIINNSVIVNCFKKKIGYNKIVFLNTSYEFFELLFDNSSCYYKLCQKSCLRNLN